MNILDFLKEEEKTRVEEVNILIKASEDSATLEKYTKESYTLLETAAERATKYYQESKVQQIMIQIERLDIQEREQLLDIIHNRFIDPFGDDEILL
jgi:hypothetical protein